MQASHQVVARIGRVLRAVSQHEPDGVTTTAAGVAADLARPTAHRLLVALQQEGLVDRTPAGLWQLGPETFLLGSAAAARYDVSHLAGASLRRLSEATGESAFFSARRGDETICLVREDGSFPIRSHVLHEGIRFPLGVASAGQVILSYLPEREITDYLDDHDLTERYGATHARKAVEQRIAETQRQGYAFNPGLIVRGSWGIGAAVFDSDESPQWALSLTGIDHRFADDRRPELGRLLLQEAHDLSRRIRRFRSQ
ncbi:IclR family transcriptional regulator [Nocardioides sp. Root151]|uniref:IclR family transcriptional regulator n=1 Tax=Nocardioides sp. Root151 TaxID=1736475 RepID=UPI000703A8CF|nr:IclR family transcriptional regulator [Nocardioides sp. Root151]KQZ75931.1 IclR family transcriptional regulator [Nocardioides sp. Root151]